MTPTETAQFRQILEVRKGELEKMLRNREAIAVDTSADMIDQIQYATDRELAIGNLERESARLREVQGALRRVHLGTFGICLECGEMISLKRLAAVPWTTTCLFCQKVADADRIAA
jgi:DnaK suppressor protein